MKCVIRSLILCWILSSHFDQAFNQIPAPARDDTKAGMNRMAVAQQSTVTTQGAAATAMSVNDTEAHKRARTNEDEGHHDGDGLDVNLDDLYPEVDSQLLHDRDQRKNLTKEEIAVWLRDSGRLFVQKLNASTSTHAEDDLEEFLFVLHGSAEAACLLAKAKSQQGDEDAGVTISGEMVNLHVEFITKKLEALLSRQKRNQKPTRTSGTRFEVEIGDSLSQYCSEVDEGLRYVCYELCLATIHFTHDLLSGPSQYDEGSIGSLPQEEIWDSFLVGADEALIIDPDTQAFVPVHKPIVFRVSVPHLKRGHKAKCLRWNFSHWDNSTCLESHQLSATVIECRCLQFGYFKIQYLVNAKSEAECTLLEFKVLNASDNSLNTTLIGNQILHQINLSIVNESCKWTIVNLKFVDTAKKENRTAILIRFQLKHSGPEADSANSACKENWKTVVDHIDVLLQNESLHIFDTEEKRVVVPRQKLHLIDSDDERRFLTEMEHMSLTAAVTILILFGVVLAVIGVAAIRKYRRKRRNSVRVLKVGNGNSFDRSLVSVSALRSNSIQAPPSASRGQPKTNVRRMSFNFPDQNQNSFSNAVANPVGLGVDSTMTLNLHALPNSTLD